MVLELELKGSFISRELARIQYILKINQLIKIRNINIVHFLYLDGFIRALMFFSTRRHEACHATNHWFYMLPDFVTGFKSHTIAFFERLFLKILILRGWRVITHSIVGANKLFGNAENVLDFPIVPMRHVCSDKIKSFRNSFGLTSSSVLLLCFGGTRFDKGADLAVKALAKLDDNYHLIVAGKEKHIAFETLAEIAKDANCSDRLHLINGFVSDEDTELLFNACDVVFIPYRKIFSGQSGPLTIGASLGKFIISSNSIIFEETLRNYNLGQVFEAENVTASAEKIQNIKSLDACRSTKAFNSAHSSVRFVEKLKIKYVE